MGLAVKVYEAFKDDEKKARVLSEVIDELESRIAPLRDVATRGDLEVTKLALQKQIEEVRLTLQKEIEEVRKEVEAVKASLVKWVAGLMVAQTGILISAIALLR